MDKRIKRWRRWRRFLAVLLFFVWFIGCLTNGVPPNIAAIGFLMMAGMAYFLTEAFFKEAEVIWWRRLTEPVFIISRHPADDRHLNTSAEEEAGAVVVHVPYRQVMAEVKRVKERLTDAGNQLYLQPARAEDRLPVVPLLFRHGEHCTEVWTGEPTEALLRRGIFAERVTDCIINMRRAYNGAAAEENAEWSVVYKAGQSGVTYETNRATRPANPQEN